MPLDLKTPPTPLQPRILTTLHLVHPEVLRSGQGIGQRNGQDLDDSELQTISVIDGVGRVNLDYF